MTQVLSRLAAVMLFALVLALAVVGVGHPVAQHVGAVEAEIAELEHQLAQLSARRAEAPVEAAPVVLDQALFEGPSAMLAATILKDRLDEAIASADGVIESLRIEEPVEDGALKRIAVTVALRTDHAGLQSLLYEIETSQPYLMVDRLDLRARRGQGDGADETPLSLQLHVTGLMELAE